MGWKNSCCLSVLSCPSVLPAVLPGGLKPQLQIINPFSPNAAAVTATTPHTAHCCSLTGQRSPGLWTSRAVLLVEASGRTLFLGFSSSGDLFPSFLFTEWVRFPGQRGRGPSFILHRLRGTCSVHRDSCGHCALLGCPGGGMKDQCSKGLKCSLRRLGAASVQSAQSDWVAALFGSFSQSAVEMTFSLKCIGEVLVQVEVGDSRG